MAEKRKAEDAPRVADYRPGNKKQKLEQKKLRSEQKRGFQVGPANLPDGIHKRKSKP